MLSPTIKNIAIGTLVSTLLVIGMKRWFKYQEAKENRQELEQ
jgi:hypothetical protein